jgi:hypothetical protein
MSKLKFSDSSSVTICLLQSLFYFLKLRSSAMLCTFVGGYNDNR